MAGRILQFSRNFSSTRKRFASLAEPLKATVNEHDQNHKAAADLWKKVFFFACCPAIVISFIKISLDEEPERPEFKNYEHLRIRKKKYPWRDGVQTLFHNPHRNALPDGYETTEGHH